MMHYVTTIQLQRSEGLNLQAVWSFFDLNVLSKYNI